VRERERKRKSTRECLCVCVTVPILEYSRTFPYSMVHTHTLSITHNLSNTLSRAYSWEARVYTKDRERVSERDGGSECVCERA